MKILTEDQIMEKLNKFYNYIDIYISKDRGTSLKNMYKELEIMLASSPASTKKDFHNAYAGGYLDHVLRVVEYSIIYDKVWDKFGQNKDYTLENLVFSAINHDLGKLGYDDKAFYLPNDEDWQIKKGIYFKYNKDLVHMRISDRSLFVLQKYNIPINENEYLAIKLHDGLYEEANKSYYMSSPDFSIKSNLPYILHQADLTATRIEQQI
jgi:hypothetical protein